MVGLSSPFEIGLYLHINAHLLVCLSLCGYIIVQCKLDQKMEKLEYRSKMTLVFFIISTQKHALIIDMYISLL